MTVDCLTKRHLWLLIMLCALMARTTRAVADTLSENFDEVERLDANGNVITSSWDYGYLLSNGWFVSPAANAISNTKEMYYGIAEDGATGNALWAGYGSSNSYYMVIPTRLCGNVTFKAYKNTSTKKPFIKFFEATEDDGVYTVTSTQLGETVVPASASWDTYSVQLGDEGKYVAINMVFCGLDDFEATIYQEGSEIAKPKSLAVTNVTTNTATLTWKAGGKESAWQLVYDTDADFNPDESTPVNITENPYTLTGLTENTTYFACIRAVSDGYSAWTEKVSFTPSSVVDLTVNDGTATNMNIPVYGLYSDTEGTMSQFIIPANSLTAITNHEITRLTFYSSVASLSLGARYKVFVKETADTNFSDGNCDWTGMTEVAEVPITLSDGMMAFNLDQTFDYRGGNLMVGFQLVTTGNYQNCYWHGVSTNSYTARYSYKSYSSTQSERAMFLPKMTIRSLPISETPQGRIELSADHLDFGKVTPETTETGKQQTFMIKNTGRADLTGISITSDQTTYQIGDYLSTLSPDDEPMTIVVTMTTETAGTHNATITITADNQDAITVAVTGIYANSPATMTITPSVDESVDFGVVHKQATKTFTVSNTGDITLHITSIASDNEKDFTVTPASLDIAGGESSEFAVTFLFDNKGFDEERSAHITLTASDIATKTFSVKGMRHEVWSEDFEEEGALDSWAGTGWTTGNYSGDTQNTTRQAISPKSTTAAIITPQLVADSEADVLMFDACYKFTDEGITVAYSDDGKVTWHDLWSYNPEEDGISAYGAYYHNKQMTVSAPVVGRPFYLRITPSYTGSSISLDNFEGFKLAPEKEDTGIADFDGRNQESKIMDSKKVHNLNGLRITNTGKGLYIINGRKVVILHTYNQ